ncbi:hypothetical protein DFJ77DRAFT_356247 [Powellomyces hirtus]|nr:hypothetical protein DFJ77DRAFT_356247 [Powellomyces hirtus]
MRRMSCLCTLALDNPGPSVESTSVKRMPFALDSLGSPSRKKLKTNPTKALIISKARPFMEFAPIGGEAIATKQCKIHIGSTGAHDGDASGIPDTFEDARGSVTIVSEPEASPPPSPQLLDAAHVAWQQQSDKPSGATVLHYFMCTDFTPPNSDTGTTIAMTTETAASSLESTHHPVCDEDLISNSLDISDSWKMAAGESEETTGVGSITFPACSEKTSPGKDIPANSRSMLMHPGCSNFPPSRDERADASFMIPWLENTARRYFERSGECLLTGTICLRRQCVHIPPQHTVTLCHLREYWMLYETWSNVSRGAHPNFKASIDFKKTYGVAADNAIKRARIVSRLVDVAGAEILLALIGESMNKVMHTNMTQLDKALAKWPYRVDQEAALGRPAALRRLRRQLEDYLHIGSNAIE